MAQYLPLPDGTFIKVQEGESLSQAFERAKQKYPEAFAPAGAAAKPEGGFIPAVKASKEELMGGLAALAGRTGLMDIEAAQKEYEARKKRAAEIFKPTEEGWTESPWTKFKETLGGSLPYMVAPVAAAGAAATLPVTGTAGTLLGLGAAGLASAGQFTATNLARQMEGEEGTMPKKQLAETELGAAALAAIPQAALDTLSLRMIPGIGRLFGQAGVKVTAENAKQIAEQGLKSTLTDYALKTGKTAGIEGLTEATQQVFERLQAGLSITDPKAREEYFESFLGGAILGGTLAPAGRFVERGQEQRKASDLLKKQADDERKAAREAEEAQKKDPEYALKLDADYQAAVARMKELQAAVPKKPGKDALPEEQLAYQEAKAARDKHLKEVLQPLAAEYVPRKAEIAKLKEQQRAAGLTPEQYAIEQLGGQAPDLTTDTAAQTGPVDTSFVDLAQSDQISAAEQYARDQVALADERELASALDPADRVGIYAGYLLENPAMAQALLKSKPILPGLNRKKSNAVYDSLKLQLEKLAGDIAAGRAEARGQRIPSEREQRIRKAQSEERQEALELEGRLEKNVLSEVGQALASDMRARENQMRTAPQLALFPEERETVTQTSEPAPATKKLDRQIDSVMRQLGEVERQLSELPAAPTAAGPYTDIRSTTQTEYGLKAGQDLSERKRQLENVLGGLRARRDEAIAASATESTTRAPVTALGAAQPDIRPQAPLIERVDTLAKQALASPKVDEKTRDLVQRVVDALPQLARLSGRNAPQEIADWLYSSRTGRVDEQANSRIRDLLDVADAAKRSETDQVTQFAGRPLTAAETEAVKGTSLEGRKGVLTRTPTGEVTRAVQTELEMPEGAAVSFDDYRAFDKYLASDGLARLREGMGLVGPTVSRLLRFLSPLQQKAAKLRKEQALLEQASAQALEKTKGDKEAAEKIIASAKYRVAVARSAVQSNVEALLSARDAAQQKFSDALTESISLAQQLVDNQKALIARLDSEVLVQRNKKGPVAFGEATEVQKGQAEAYTRYVNAKNAFEQALDAWMDAETKKRDTVQSNIGKDWSDTSVVWGEYSRAKKAADKARKQLQAARNNMDTLRAKVPQDETVTSDDFQKFLVEEASIFDQLQTQLRRMGGFKAALNRFSKFAGLEDYVNARDAAHFKFNAALKTLDVGNDTFSKAYAKYIAPLKERLDELSDNFSTGTKEDFDTLDKAREELALAVQLQAEVAGLANFPREQAEALAGLAKEKQASAVRLEAQVRARQAEATARAEKRTAAAPKTTDTLAEREARDAEKRKEEQARLERADQGPRTQITFKRSVTEDNTVRALIEQAQAAQTGAERAAIRKQLDEYLQNFISRKNEELKEMQRLAAQNIENKEKQRQKVAQLTAKLKTKLTAKRRKSAEKQLEDAERKLAEHERRYTLNTRELKITRTDIQAQRQERKRLLAEASGRRVTGERLGVAEGTQARATGPVTRKEVMPPKGMRTGSEESRAGETTTPADMRLREARGKNERDVPMTAREVAEANRIAAELTAKTPQQKAKEQKEALEVQKEQAKLQPQPTKVKPLKAATEKKKAKRTRSEVIEDIEEDLYEAPDVELLGGAEEDVFFSRGVEVESPDLTKEQVQALENNDVAQALALLSTDKSADRVHRAVAQRLAQLLDATTVEVKDQLTDEKGNPVLGQALASGKKIRLSRAGGLNQEVLLHEATHAAAERVLSMPESLLTPLQLTAKRELQKLHATIKRDPGITSADAKGSLSEFVAEVMSNRNLQQQLAKKRWKLADALVGFKSIVLRLLGVKDTQSMLGAAMKSVDAIFMPTSVQQVPVPGTRTQYSQKDIAALDDGSNSMRQFAENFPQFIKQKDRTPQDVDRIGEEYLIDMMKNPEDYVAAVASQRLDFKPDLIMSDGKSFDPHNLKHFVEAEVDTFFALEAALDPDTRIRMADQITRARRNALVGLLKLLGVEYRRMVPAIPTRRRTTARPVTPVASVKNNSYTLPEKALVAKAASKYGIQSTPEGRLKLVNLDANNRHPVAVVSLEAADAIIEELRAGKNLKAAFLDGMQRIADKNAERNKTKNGWQKFKQAKGGSLKDLYTEKEIDAAFGETGYDNDAFVNDTALIEQLIKDGLLPDRRTSENLIDVEKAAVELNAGAAGTSWCTGASLTTARDQIENGDFYIYYENGKPEVAVRMNKTSEVAEIRGNTPNQWLNNKQRKIAQQFLKAQKFERGQDYVGELEKKETLRTLVNDPNGINNPAVQEVFAFTSLLDIEGNINEDSVEQALTFRYLDGYTRRPPPTNAVKSHLAELLKRLTQAQIKNGRIPAMVMFKDQKSGIFKIDGEERTIDANDLVVAAAISFFPSKARTNKTITFPNLKKVNTLRMWGSVNAPKLEQIFQVDVGADTRLKVNKNAYIDFVSSSVKKEKLSIDIEGGYFVGIKPVDYFTDFYVLDAEIDAPYVKTYPLDQDALIDLKIDKKTKADIPEATVVTPNKIGDTPPVQFATLGFEDTLLFARAANYSDDLAEAGRIADKLVPKSKTLIEKIANNLGLNFRTQYVDKVAPTEEALRAGVEGGSIEAFEASQAMYYIRSWEHRMNMVAQAIGVGAPVLRKIKRADGADEYVIEAEEGATIKDVVDVLADKKVVKAAGSADAANRLFTLFLAAIRADRVGYDKLNFGRAAAEKELQQIDAELKRPNISDVDVKRIQQRREYLRKNMDSMPSEAEIKAARSAIENDPVLKKAFGEARDIYNDYNRNLVRFAVQSGYLSKETAARLLKDNDYVPYYRIRGGVAEMIIGSETPIRIGNLKDSPYLDELVGGEEPIMDFLNSSVQNTSMLLDMSMKNLAQKEAMWALAKSGLAKIQKAGKSGAPKGAVDFKKDGEDWYAIVDTDHVGIPSELLTKGLAGIPTMLPAGIRWMGLPAQILRRAITASPVYMLRQLIRDSTGAFLGSGSNAAPVLGTLKQLRKAGALERRGVTGGQMFTGMPEDVARLLSEMQSGRPGWARAFSKLEAMSMEVDAATRRSQYESYLNQGLSEMEATLASIESMNFLRRGVSPGVHWASTLIPFLNAQIQSLDTLYRALSGKMPFNEQLKIREKLFTRGALLATAAVAYAMAMEDEEEYKNARPDEKYNNFFVRLPFLDDMAGERVTVRVPIPFEIGYIFKSLPEAIYNTVTTEHGGEEAAKAFTGIARNLIPGGSSYGMPAAIKPLIEVGLGKSFFTGRDIESAREQEVQAGLRYRDNTTNAAKFVGEMLNVSPIKLEFLINGYTGSMGMALLGALNPIVPGGETEKATKRLADLAVVGSLFQPADATGIIDATYEALKDATEAQATYKELVRKGEIQKANAYIANTVDELTLAGLAGKYKQYMGDLTKAETAVRGSRMSDKEKREALDKIRAAKIQVANAVRGALDKTKRPASPA